MTSTAEFGPRAAVAVFLTALAPTITLAQPTDPAPTFERLADGSELVLVRMPGARTLSFRYLVHSGGNVDPSPGLAHLLEHVIFHGSYGDDQLRLFRDAHAAGAHINGLTAPDSTHYILDAPRTEAPALVGRMLRALTNPVLAPAAIERERDVVLAESELSPSEGVYSMMAQLLSPAFRNAGGVIGTQATRRRIERADLAAFFQEHYRPANVTVVLVGDIDLPEAHALVSANTLRAPGRPVARGTVPFSLTTPMDAQLPAPLYISLVGYDLSSADRSTCEALAELLGLRIRLSLTIDRSVASDARATCMRIGGAQLLAALAWGTSYDSAEIRDVLEQAYRDLSLKAMTRAEELHLERRAQIHRALLRASPPDLAEALVAELASQRPGASRRGAVVRMMAAPVFDASEMTRTARSFVVDARRVTINTSPFE